MAFDPPPPADRDTDSRWDFLDPTVNLGTRYALVFAGAGVAATLLLSLIGGRIFRNHIETGSGSRLETLAYQISDKLDRGMSERFREIQLAASNPVLRDPAVAAVDKRTLLESMRETLPDYAWIGVTDADGRIATATLGWLEGTDVAERDWFTNAHQQPAAGSMVVVAEVADRLSGTAEEKPRFITVSAPVFTPGNVRFAGVLGAFVNWPWVRETVESVVPETPSPEKLMVTVYDLSGNVLYDSHSAAGINLSKPLSSPTLPRGHEYRGSMIESTADGDYLTGYIRSRGYHGFRNLNWFFTVRQPMATAFAPVYAFQRSVILVGFGFSVLLGIVGIVFARSITRRLRAIASASDRIREGDVTSLVPSFRDESEMARMASSLGRMVEDLRTRNETLTEELRSLRKALKNADTKTPRAALSPDEESLARNPNVRGRRNGA